jgi:hypothetical protein
MLLSEQLLLDLMDLPMKYQNTTLQIVITARRYNELISKAPFDQVENEWKVPAIA